MKWMLDTDTCIAMIKHQPASILRRLSGKSIGQVGISSITLGELAFGASKSGRSQQSKAALGEFLLALEVAAFDEVAALQYGSIRAALERHGTPIGPLDTLIAAHALSTDSVLVSHNTREFKRVPGLRCEDWLK
ncbi:MAG TPA: type II toxin-antitoxin system VapC family toxin [Steroidobacteraceae bacterium]|nr:type II toxin-antitoxin system VapC family toxin [Steroidobacteraceae bacterium]